MDVEGEGMSETFENRDEFLSLVRASLQPFILVLAAVVQAGTDRDLNVCRHVVSGVLDSAGEMQQVQKEHGGNVH